MSDKQEVTCLLLPSHGKEVRYYKERCSFMGTEGVVVLCVVVICYAQKIKEKKSIIHKNDL